MDQRLSNRIISNLLWRFAERSGAQLVQFIVAIVLARYIEPSSYGIISLVIIFTQILQVFVDSGLGNALIQKKDADDLDFSTVFYFNTIWCLILYAIIFFLAPFIAKFYANDNLVIIIRVLCISVIISGVKNIQQAYVSRNLQFKNFFFATIIGTIISAVVGILMAVNGYGVWSIIVQKLLNLSIDTLVLWITVKWRPKFIFSINRLRNLLSYGWKLLVSALLNSLYNNMRNLIIGKVYTVADLAYYNKANQFPSLVVVNINTSIDSVLLPSMSKFQENTMKIKSMVRRSIQVSTFIMAPLMVGLMVCSESLVRLVLTDKWIECVPYMRIFCVTYMFYPIHTANLNAINSMGRSDLFLKLEIIKKIIGILLLVTTMYYGVMIMAYSLLISSFLSQIINAWPNKKLLGYGYIDQIRDISPSIVISIIMGILIVPIGFFRLSNLKILILQVLIGAILYISLSRIFKIKVYLYLLEAIKEYIKKFNKTTRN